MFKAECKSSLETIKPRDLGEIANMKNPSEVVKNVLEAILVLLGTKIDDWKACQNTLRGPFVKQIENLDYDNIS